MTLPRSPRRLADRSKPYKKLGRGSRIKQSRSTKKGRDAAQRAAYDAAGREAIRRSGGRCEADGIHHLNCPGYGTVRHHIHEQSKGGTDESDNVLWVWGGDTVGGVGGCHGRIGSERQLAIELGYLVIPEYERPAKSAPGPWQT